MIEVLVDTHGQEDIVKVFNQADFAGKDNLGRFNLKSDGNISTIVSELTETDIPVVDLFIPDGFSPNGDGINDNFEITHPISLKIELEVYNRWGNLVYKSTDYQNNWDGRGSGNLFGQELPGGTYYCLCKAINISTGQVVSNGVKSITLRR
jgi:gliding motility-associated-like protein